MIPEPEKAQYSRELREIFLDHINSLRPTKNTRTQQFILQKIYFEDWSIMDLALELNLSNQRVSRLLDEAHKRLRNDTNLMKKLEDWNTKVIFNQSRHENFARDDS